MRGLLLQLSALDAGAESALRVIGFFDQLTTGRASLHEVVRATAKLAGCAAGVEDSVPGIVLRADPAGNVTSGRSESQAERPAPASSALPPSGRGWLDREGHAEGAASASSARSLDLPPSGRVWLEREGAALPLDDIVLERFAIAVAPLLEHARGPLPELGDTALVELALSATAGEAERARAVRLLGFEPTTRLRVLAVAGDVADVRPLLTTLREAGPGLRTASLGSVHAVLATSFPDALPASDAQSRGIRIGVGPEVTAIHAAESWPPARTALRFTALNAPYPALAHADELGALPVLADRLRVEDIAKVADVAALDRIAAEPNGTDTLAILLAYCVTGSARKTATRVYRHHTTVTARLAHVESRLGFSFAAPVGRMRLELAVILRLLRDTVE